MIYMAITAWLVVASVTEKHAMPPGADAWRAIRSSPMWLKYSSQAALSVAAIAQVGVGSDLAQRCHQLFGRQMPMTRFPGPPAQYVLK
jgi:hypothetical protein